MWAFNFPRVVLSPPPQRTALCREKRESKLRTPCSSQYDIYMIFWKYHIKGRRLCLSLGDKPCPGNTACRKQGKSEEPYFPPWTDLCAVPWKQFLQSHGRKPRFGDRTQGRRWNEQAWRRGWGLLLREQVAEGRLAACGHLGGRPPIALERSHLQGKPSPDMHACARPDNCRCVGYHASPHLGRPLCHCVSLRYQQVHGHSQIPTNPWQSTEGSAFLRIAVYRDILLFLWFFSPTL